MKKTQILVVEDEKIIAESICDMLNSLGYRVSAYASSGKEAIKKAEKTQPDLVLMDIMLKGRMDGVETAEHIRNLFDIPVIYLTAYADEKTLQRAKITEPFGYMLKPFYEKELHSTIEMALYKNKIERKLKEREHWLSTVLKSIGDAVITTDKEGLITFMNFSAESLSGWRHEEATGKNFREIFDIKINEEIYSPDVKRTMKKSQKEYIPPANQALLIKKNRTKIPIDCSEAPLRDNKENVLGNVLILRDITEHKEAEKKLRESEERAKAQYKNFPIPTYTWRKANGKFVLIDFNNAAEKISNNVIINLLGKKYEEVYPNMPEILEGLSSCYTEKTLVKQEIQHQLDFTNKKSKCFDLTYVYVSPDHVMIHIEDITKAKEIDRMKSELISNVSHELRTPLSIIKEGISLVLDGVLGKIKGDQKDVLSRVMNNINRLTRLINDLLCISKIEAGKIELKKSLVNISTLAEELFFSFKNQADEKSIKLKNRFNIKTPYIFIDSDKISQVITNLISNSIKFTPEKGQITLEIEDMQDEIDISIEDTGIGIAKEKVPELFDRFTQVNRDVGPGMKGTGLGLAISKEIVEIHKGRIWVESEIGKGSRFTFSLPRLNLSEIFKEYLMIELKKLKEKHLSLSLVIIHIKNLNEIETKHSNFKRSLIIQEIEEIIRKALRRKSDTVFRYRSGEILIAVLMDTPKKHTLAFKERIKKAIDTEAKKREWLKAISILFYELTYPDDAKNEVELIDKIEKKIRI